jgi:hypothetical protein
VESDCNSLIPQNSENKKKDLLISIGRLRPNFNKNMLIIDLKLPGGDIIKQKKIPFQNAIAEKFSNLPF